MRDQEKMVNKYREENEHLKNQVFCNKTGRCEGRFNSAFNSASAEQALEDSNKNIRNLMNTNSNLKNTNSKLEGRLIETEKQLKDTTTLLHQAMDELNILKTKQRN